ncbi:hypothetical protein V8C35DRAFT_331597 [Trichoderma chlorosporum]
MAPVDLSPESQVGQHQTLPNSQGQWPIVSRSIMSDLWYTVAKSDSCSSVAASFGITVAQFLTWNPAVSSDCAQNFWVGDAYCVGVSSATTTPGGPTFPGIPCTCDEYYTIVKGDGCPGVATKFGITVAQFLQWNPAVSSDCSSNFWVGNSYCVGVSGSKACPSTTTSAQSSASSSKASSKTSSTVFSKSSSTTTSLATKTTSVATTAGPTPATPTFPGIPCQCNLYYEVVDGDTCPSVESQFKISSDEFFAWNPSVSTDCKFNFYIGYSYCVGVSSDTSCSSSSSSVDTASINTATYSYITEGTFASSAPHPTATGWPPQPTQSGVPSNCQQYYQADRIDTCASIQHRYSHQMSMDQFLEWNPSVGANCTNLFVNYYYCIMVPTAYTDLPNATTQFTFSTPLTFPATPTWNVTQYSELQTTFSGAATPCPILIPAPWNSTCDSFASVLGISVDNLESWNNGINCTSLTPLDLYCVANPSSTLPVVTSTSTPVSSGPQPQLPGTASDCSQFWFVSGKDNCTTIASSNGITETQLEGWNPSLGSSCSGLKPSYFVCVSAGANSGSPPPVTSSTGTSTKSGVSSTATKTTSPTVTWSTPTPTQSGMVSGCSWFYLVEANDSCYDIAQDAGISLDSLYSMNPEIGTSCGSLLSGFYICLGTTGAPKTVTSGTPVAPTPQPIQTGMSSSCTRFYLVQPGDDCADLSKEAGISLSDFESWNTGLGANCNLKSGFYVCIGTSSAGTTITSGTPVPVPTS